MTGAGPQRLAVLGKHVVAAGTASGATTHLTEEDRWKILEAINQYRLDADKLKEDGSLPAMSMFDLLLATKNEMGVMGRKETAGLMEDALEKGSLKVLEMLPGPWKDAQSKEERVSLLREHQVAQLGGQDVQLYARWQLKYGDAGLGSNIVAPKLQSLGSGTETKMVVIPRVIVGDAADAARISRTHVRKEGNFEGTLFDSIIATTDNDLWRAQREHLNEVFLPLASLSKIMPVSLARAKKCADRLAGLLQGGALPAGVVDMSDFLLHEAQAQLQLALLGAPEELMDATNEDIRASFMGDHNAAQVGDLGKAMKALVETTRADESLAVPSEGRPVRGPLARAVKHSGLGPSADYGNMLLILFAGHDTTGHTMTWLLFELCRHPELQNEVFQEVEAYFQSLGGRDPTYWDLGKLPLLDRCITETLRLWPAVASGTYRQLQFDDHVRGPGGQQIMLPRGTPMHIVNWSRHRNPALWGPDADEFNPHRDFAPEELARVAQQGAAMTPQSDRFSPFAHAPRSCLGKNFAQMEMRLILTTLFHRFRFSLAPPYDKLMGARLSATPEAHEFTGVNRATMGPKDPERSTMHSWGERHVYAMRLHVTPRS